MALVLANRVQESATANTTVSFTLTGAVAGFQTFAVIGDTNTTYYSATDASGNWEVGLGTYSSTGPTLTRTTIYASSNGGSAVTFSGAVNVFVTYPSGKSVNLDGSGNVSALGTVASGTWQGSTVGVAYGGTGVTASSGANSVMLRDANQNVAVNRLNQSNTDTSAAGGTTALTAASSYSQTLIGTGSQTFTMPDATTLTTGVAFVFNNNATGTVTLQDYATGSIGTITSGGACELVLLANGTVAGTWDVHGFLPENVTWGTNALALGSTVITGGTWQGGTVQPAYGGTGLTTFTGANNALYSTGATTLTAGTLPVAAGGTGLSSYTAGDLPYYAAGTALSKLGIGAANTVLTSSGTAPQWSTSLTLSSITDSGNLTFTGTGNRITGDFSNATVANRALFQSSTTNGATAITAIPNGTSAQAQFTALNSSSDPNNASGVQILANASEARVQAANFGTGTYLPMTFYTGGSERMRIDTSGNVGIGTSSPASRLHAYTSAAEISRFTSTATNGGYLVMSPDNATLTYIGSQKAILATGNASDFAIVGTGANNLVLGTNSVERMRIDTSGNVGIGTSSPSAKLDVKYSNTAYAGGLYIENTATTGNAWGRLDLKSANATNSFVLAQDQGGTAYVTQTGNYPITFATNNTERARIDSSGNLLVGATVNSVYDNVAAARPLLVQSSSTATTPGSSTNSITICNSDTTTNNVSQINFAAITGASTNQYSAAWIACQYGARTNSQYPTGQLIFATSTATNNAPSEKMRLSAAGGLSVGTTADPGAGAIYATGNITAYYSDDRLKTRLGKIENALDKLCSLEGFYYEANETAQALGYEAKREVGVSAQQVQAVMPEIVAPAPIDPKYMTVRYERALPLLIEAIKELREEVRALKG